MSLPLYYCGHHIARLVCLSGARTLETGVVRMSINGVVQIVLYLVVLIALAKPLGSFMARVYQGEPTFPSRILGPVERLMYRLFGIDPAAEMSWKTSTIAMLLFSAASVVLVYLLQRVQGFLPLNPQAFGAVTPDSSFNTDCQFCDQYELARVRRRNDDGLIFAQMVALTSQNFVSAAAGMAVLVAFVRAFVRQSGETLGNFWVDLTARGPVYLAAAVGARSPRYLFHRVWCKHIVRM